MSKVIFELDKSGVRELMQSDEAMAICKNYAEKAQSQLGDGYSVSTYTGKTRVNASVMAETVKARIENSRNNTILKAVFSQ